MKVLSIFVCLLYVLSCNSQTTIKSQIINKDTMESYNTFDKANHLQPDFDKAEYDTIHSWELGWALLKPINIASDKEKEILLSKQLSPGQKALYFFWYLDADVTNGGFIQFYWNGNGKYISPILDGLKLIGDTAMFELVSKANNEFIYNKDKFVIQKKKQNWDPLYKNLKKFDEYNKIYYSISDKTMELIEKYARLHSDEFVKLK